MQLLPFWVGNFILDFAKLEFVVLLDILMMYVVGFEWKTVNLILPLVPFPIVLWAYVLSFLFTTENLANLATLLTVFFCNGLMAMEVWYKRTRSADELDGDV